MIRTISDLIQQLRQNMVPILDQEPVSHPVAIGDMYEGLTAELLEMALPPSLEHLAVVTGFIEGKDGRHSGQIDCMIVKGEGRFLPYSRHQVFSLDDVLCAIEVKKRSNRKDIKEAIEHLGGLLNCLPDVLHYKSLTDDALARLVGYRPWLADMTEFSDDDLFVRRECLVTSHLPLRVVLTHHGFSRQGTFPRVLESYLSEVEPSENMLATLPECVIDGSRAFVKLIGLPYALPVREGRWVYYAEIENPPMLTLLEQILWRLKPYMKVAFPAFADDDSIPNLRPLVGADSSTSGVRISPMEGQIPGQAFSFAALEEGIEISEEEYRLLYPFISFLSLSMTDENWIEMSGLSQGEHRDAVRRLSELRVLFTCGDDVFVNLDAMRLCVAGRSGFLVGEDSRGRLGRSTLRSRSHDAPSGTRVLHVALDNPWDNNVVGLVGFEVPTGEERLIDHVRYTHLEAATERLRRQDSSGGSVTEDQMQLRGSEAEGVDQE